MHFIFPQTSLSLSYLSPIFFMKLEFLQTVLGYFSFYVLALVIVVQKKGASLDAWVCLVSSVTPHKTRGWVPNDGSIHLLTWRSQFLRCSSRICKKSWTAESSVSIVICLGSLLYILPLGWITLFG